MDLLPLKTGQFIVLVVLGETERCQPLDLIDELRSERKDLAFVATQLIRRVSVSGFKNLPTSWLCEAEAHGLLCVEPFGRPRDEPGLFQGKESLRLYFFQDGPMMIVLAGADRVDKSGHPQGDACRS